uniref:Uncharacterized protein n=1 Tax=viral metagenome TaxID=1070528 RepID=A0A6M3L6N0_9ZZZZ
MAMKNPFEDHCSKRLIKVGFAHYIDFDMIKEITPTRLKPGQTGFNKDGITFYVKVTFNNDKTQTYYGSAALGLNLANAYSNLQK